MLAKKPMINRACCVFVILSLVACEKRSPARGDTQTRAETSAVRSPETPLSVSALGIGSLRIGMTIAEASAAVAGFKFPSQAQECGYASAASLPAGLRIMVEKGRVVRIDVDTNTIPTTEGARVGDTVPHIHAIYGPRVTTSPNHDTSEPDLTVRSASPGDTIHEIIFETLRGRVVRYRAGQRPQVRYIERCG
jgi:hypothetical protein